MIARCVLPPVLGLTVLFAACKKPTVEAYRVPKETAATPAAPESPPVAPSETKAAPPLASAPQNANPPPSAQTPSSPSNASGGMASTPVATASGADLTWTAPAHWKPKPVSAMRKGSFDVSGEGAVADLSITAFPGSVGGELANLNRWRGQVDLPPASQADYEASRQLVEHNGLKMIVVDIQGGGPTPRRILGAMIPFGSATWFVKLGPAPDALVVKEKPAFLAFLQTVKPPAK